MTPALIDATAAALTGMLPFTQPADVALSKFFRSRPKLGGRDRAFIAESAYGVIRHLRSLEHLCEGRNSRRLLLAWLARHGGHTLRQTEAYATPAEQAWLKEIKAAGLDGLPEAVRLELPDWLHEKLHDRFQADLPGLMASLNRPAPLDLRVNSLRMSRDAVIKQLDQDGIAAEPTPYSTPCFSKARSRCRTRAVSCSPCSPGRAVARWYATSAPAPAARPWPWAR